MGSADEEPHLFCFLVVWFFFLNFLSHSSLEEVVFMMETACDIFRVVLLNP